MNLHRQLAVCGAQAGRRKPLSVLGKGDLSGHTLGIAGIPLVDGLEGGVVNRDLRQITAGIGDHRHRSVGGHLRQQNGLGVGVGIQCAGSAFHPQLVPGPVIQHKAGLAAADARAGVVVGDAAQLCAPGGKDHQVLAAQLHKTAAQALHLERFGDAGLHRPAATGLQPDAGGFHHIAQQRQATAENAAGIQRQRQQHHQCQCRGAQPAHPAAVPQRAQAGKLCPAGRLIGFHIPAPFLMDSSLQNAPRFTLGLARLPRRQLGIIHPGQEQALGREGWARLTAVPAFQNGRDPLWVQLVLAR